MRGGYYVVGRAYIYVYQINKGAIIASEIVGTISGTSYPPAETPYRFYFDVVYTILGK